MLPEDLGDDLTATLWAQEGHPGTPGVLLGVSPHSPHCRPGWFLVHL